MKNLFDSLKEAIASIIVGAALLLAPVQGAGAVTVVVTIPAGEAWNATNLISGSGRITAITILQSGNSATNTTYAFVDCPVVPNVTNGWGGIYATNTGYMSAGSYLTNITRIQTNFGGVYLTPDGLYSNLVTISNALWTYTNYVGQTSNLWRRIAVGTVASNGGTTTLTIPSTGIPVIYGLGFTNNNVGVAQTITITYTPSL